MAEDEVCGDGTGKDGATMERIWSYFIQLGSNMWRDKWSRPDFHGPMQTQATGQYHTVMYTEKAVWRRVVDFLPACGVNTVVIDLGEGLQYATHPELSVPGAWSHDELREELARMREMGLEPVPKLNFSSCHDTWLGDYAHMKSTATYYEVTKHLIDEVCEVFDHPRLFHIGMDEEDVPNHRKSMTIIRCNDLWYHDLYYFVDCVEKNGARPWVWSDYYRAHSDDFAQKMPKDCIQSECCYERFLPRDANGRFAYPGMQSLVDLSHMGYDQIPTVSTWACHQNLAQTILLFEEEGLMDEHLLGFLDAPWQMTTTDNVYTLLDDAHRLKYAKELFERSVSDR